MGYVGVRSAENNFGQYGARTKNLGGPVIYIFISILTLNMIAISKWKTSEKCHMELLAFGPPPSLNRWTFSQLLGAYMCQQTRLPHAVKLLVVAQFMPTWAHLANSAEPVPLFSVRMYPTPPFWKSHATAQNELAKQAHKFMHGPQTLYCYHVLYIMPFGFNSVYPQELKV